MKVTVINEAVSIDKLASDISNIQKQLNDLQDKLASVNVNQDDAIMKLAIKKGYDPSWESRINQLQKAHKDTEAQWDAYEKNDEIRAKAEKEYMKSAEYKNSQKQFANARSQRNKLTDKLMNTYAKFIDAVDANGTCPPKYKSLYKTAKDELDNPD